MQSVGAGRSSIIIIAARGALMFAAATVGALHTLAPDHWVPFAALARANKCSVRQTARTTMLCGFGHLTVSAVLAILVAFAGLEVLEHLGARLERQATFLLIAFGFVYLIWGLRRSFSRHTHRHWHTRSAGGPPAVPPAAGRRPSRRNRAAEPAAEQPARPPALREETSLTT